jgi:hypothetical protein
MSRFAFSLTKLVHDFNCSTNGINIKSGTTLFLIAVVETLVCKQTNTLNPTIESTHSEL